MRVTQLQALRAQLLADGFKKLEEAQVWTVLLTSGTSSC